MPATEKGMGLNIHFPFRFAKERDFNFFFKIGDFRKVDLNVKTKQHQPFFLFIEKLFHLLNNLHFFSFFFNKIAFFVFRKKTLKYSSHP